MSKREEVLQRLSEGEITVEEANAALAPKQQDFAMNVTQEKKCLRIVGPGVFFRGMTGYADGWKTVLKHADEIRQFLKDNEEELATCRVYTSPDHDDY